MSFERKLTDGSDIHDALDGLDDDAKWLDERTDIGAALLVIDLVRNRQRPERLPNGGHAVAPRAESALVKCRPAEITGNE